MPLVSVCGKVAATFTIWSMEKIFNAMLAPGRMRPAYGTAPTMKTSGKLITFLLIAWLLGAIAIGASGQVAALRPPAPQLVIFGLTAIALALTLLVSPFRAWADQVSIRALVAVHLARFVGAYFLILAHRGRLAPGFAIPAGWGDLLVAALALILLVTVKPDSASRRVFYFAWNVLGCSIFSSSSSLLPGWDFPIPRPCGPCSISH